MVSTQVVPGATYRVRAVVDRPSFTGVVFEHQGTTPHGDNLWLMLTEQGEDYTVCESDIDVPKRNHCEVPKHKNYGHSCDCC